jgi:hypothetical protein
VGNTGGSDATLRTLRLADPEWAAIVLDTKDLAKRQFEALHADPRARERARIRVARAAYTAFSYGDRQPADHGLHLSRRLLEAELAASSTHGERQAAHERYWSRALLLETVRKARIDTGGPISGSDYLQARAARLAAERALARTRTRKDGR